MFGAVILAITLVQFFFVEGLGIVVRCAALTKQQHAACLLWGSTTLIVNVLIKKFTPNKVVQKLPIFIDENKAISEDPLMKFYNSKAKGKVLNKEDATKKQGIAPEWNKDWSVV